MVRVKGVFKEIVCLRSCCQLTFFVFTPGSLTASLPLKNVGKEDHPFLENGHFLGGKLDVKLGEG